MAIQEEFKDSHEMTSRAISLIKENQNELTEIRHGYFEDIPMGYMGANIKLSIHSVYENGVIYDITCYPDAGAGAYDIYTKAYLICVNGLEPEFRISSLGYVDEALLGSRIDKELIDYLKGNNPKEKTTIFNIMKQKKLEKLKRIKMELLYEKIKAIVASSVASEKKKK